MAVQQFPPSRRTRSIEPYRSISPISWAGQSPQPYDWMVDGAMLRGTVSMLSGDGGVGKSLLAQQLLTAAAVGVDWLGLATKPCAAYGFFCEDDEDELQRRQAKINKHYNCDMGDLERLTYVSRVGQENVLLEFDRRTDKPQPTPLFGQLEQSIRESGAQMVLIDTVADTFGGIEISRVQVRRFITALRALAVSIEGCIILTAHPSMQGMVSGRGTSGSTAWNNSVRSRMYLTRDEAADGEDPDDNDRRVLRTMKNNQGPGRGKIPLTWDDGVFVRMGAAAGTGDRVDHIQVEVALLEVARRMVQTGAEPLADPHPRNSLVNMARQMAETRAYSWGALVAAQNRLVSAGRLELAEAGPASKRRKFVRLPE